MYQLGQSQFPDLARFISQRLGGQAPGAAGGFPQAPPFQMPQWPGQPAHPGGPGLMPTIGPQMWQSVLGGLGQPNYGVPRPPALSTQSPGLGALLPPQQQQVASRPASVFARG